MPSNQELGYEEGDYIYRTNDFLEWGLCPEHGVLYRIYHGCNECKNQKDRKVRRRGETVRFVMICRKGHLDDVNWDLLIHKNSSCRSEYYLWERKGSSLKDITIMCPRCGKEVNLGWAYQRKWPCSGRRPEAESGIPHREECKEMAQIVQRQASIVYMPEILTLFTIPPVTTRLHRALRLPAVITTLQAGGDEIKDKSQLERSLKNLQKYGRVSEETIREILRHEWETVRKAIDDVLYEEKSEINSLDELLEQEFNALREASKRGYPPYKPSGHQEVLFQAEKARKISCGSDGMELLITPVTKLHAVLVLTGYRRLEPNAEPRDIGFRRGDEIWYPGCELLGEGLFITLADDLLDLSGEDAGRWMEAYSSRSGEYRPHVFRSEERRELHPVFVWWHTLSHFLIKAISFDCGYPAASIRERVYVTQISGHRAAGGVILYAVQPGGGTLGGLISQVARFERIMDLVRELAENCSNDPVCFENAFRIGDVHGASCYACTMVSETSCEHRNMWLDRRVLLEAPPWA